ncbi:MAG: hypothetical protein DHS20C02_20380 [Micavibrio sp.]|nr:MAG: hypothetical protein DHS20C02_20380 [Micavibrio sp.]
MWLTIGNIIVGGVAATAGNQIGKAFGYAAANITGNDPESGATLGQLFGTVTGWFGGTYYIYRDIVRDGPDYNKLPAIAEMSVVNLLVLTLGTSAAMDKGLIKKPDFLTSDEPTPIERQLKDLCTQNAYDKSVLQHVNCDGVLGIRQYNNG